MLAEKRRAQRSDRRRVAEGDVHLAVSEQRRAVASGMRNDRHMNVIVTHTLRSAASMHSPMRRNAGSPSIQGTTRLPSRVG